MELLKSLYLTEMMHTISEALVLPVVLLLLAFIVYSLYAIGTLVVEVVFERRHYRAKVPELVARLDAADPEDLGEVIEESGLLRAQKDDLTELVTYLYLPTDARTEVAKRLLANENNAYQKVIGRTDVMSKVAPMLGLMGTLIPLGPGIVALGAGDTATLSDALLVAFDTTVAGLATAAVCFIISRVRKRWYNDYLVSMEAAFNTVLEKAQILHERGYRFERSVLSYDSMGRKARPQSIASDSIEAKVAGRHSCQSEENRQGAGRSSRDKTAGHQRVADNLPEIVLVGSRHAEGSSPEARRAAEPSRGAR